MRRNVIAYMRERGAFAEYEPLRLDGSYAGARVIDVELGKLDWNPEAPTRAVAVVLREFVDVFNETKRGRGAWVRRECQEIARVPVPHWDYDGIDPLVAREPWERAQAERLLDYQGEWRRRDADTTRELDHAHRQLDAIESLVADGCACESPADYLASMRNGD